MPLPKRKTNLLRRDHRENVQTDRTMSGQQGHASDPEMYRPEGVQQGDVDWQGRESLPNFGATPLTDALPTLPKPE